MSAKDVTSQMRELSVSTDVTRAQRNDRIGAVGRTPATLMHPSAQSQRGQAHGHEIERVRRTFINDGTTFRSEDQQGRLEERKKANDIKSDFDEDSEYFSDLGAEFLGVTHPEVFNTNGLTLDELIAASRDKMNELKKGTFLSLYCVDISEAGNINCVFEYDLGVLAAIRKEMETAKLEPLHRDLVALGTLVVAPLGRRAEYGRAKIIAFPRHNFVELEFIDLGIICSVLRKDLREMLSNLKKIPGIVKRCVLINMTPKAISMNYVKMLRKFMDGREFCYQFSKLDVKDGVTVYGGLMESIDENFDLKNELIKTGTVYAISSDAE